MTSRQRLRTPLAATAAAVLALMLAACGGGNGEPPPAQGGSNTVVAAAPVVTITNNIPAEVATGPITFTFSFSQDVGTSFTSDDVLVEGGTRGGFTRLSGTSATLVVTPPAGSSGTVRVTVVAGGATDATGLGNAAATAAKAFQTPAAGGGGGGGGGGSGATTAAIDFESATPPTFRGFGGAEDASVVTDPTDANNKVARIVKSAAAETFAGTVISTGPNESIPRIAFSAGNTTITARVWSPVAGIPVRMKVENAANDAVFVETEATVTTAAGWQTLSFDFANQVAGTPALNLSATYDKLVVFFNFGTGGAATGERTYFIDDIVFPVAADGGGGTGGGTAGALVFASGFRQGGTNAGAGITAQGGVWGYFSGDFSNYVDTFTGGGFASDSPPVADDNQFFFIAVITNAPTAPEGNPPSSGGFLGMYVTHPGMALTGQTTLAVNLGMDANFFQQTGNKTIDVLVVGSTVYSNGSGGECRVTLRGQVVPTTPDMITYTLPLAGMDLVQPCNGGGFTSGVTSVAQALTQPIGAVNTQFSFPNVNTTVNSGTATAPVYATGIARGKTEFR
jgi:hypothetical protein